MRCRTVALLFATCVTLCGSETLAWDNCPYSYYAPFVSGCSYFRPAGPMHRYAVRPYAALGGTKIRRHHQWRHQYRIVKRPRY